MNGGHKVTIRYSPLQDYASKKKGYDVSFEVNKSTSWQAGIKNQDRHKIINGVKQSMHEIITKHKPEILFFKGNNDKKHAFYGKVAKHLAKKYKGSVSGGGDPDIKLRNNWKLELK